MKKVKKMALGGETALSISPMLRGTGPTDGGFPFPIPRDKGGGGLGFGGGGGGSGAYGGLDTIGQGSQQIGQSLGTIQAGLGSPGGGRQTMGGPGFAFKKGGKVSSASKRADGIATKGKTRGKMC